MPLQYSVNQWRKARGGHISDGIEFKETSRNEWMLVNAYESGKANFAAQPAIE